MKKITFILISLICSLGFSQTFTDTGGPYDMQNGATGTSSTCGTFDLTLPLAVAGIGTLGGTNSIENVTINITHTWADDVVISLQDPSGAVTVLLLDDNGGQADGFNVVLQDGATMLPDGGVNGPAITGTFAPIEGLGSFNAGTVADGTWNLLVCDDAGGDVGTIDDWSITFGPTPSCATPAGVAVAGITTTSADFSWNDVPSATLGFEWGILAPGGDPDVDPFLFSGTTAASVLLDSEAGLSPTTDYVFYVRGNCDMAGFSPWSPGTAFTTATPPPANDECSGAITLTVNTDLSCAVITSATTSGATASPQPDDATGTPNNDVWFSFVATGTSHQIVISNVVNQGGGTSTSTDMGMSVFNDLAGCSMVAANEVGESDPNTLSLSGLTPSSTYYVRVYGWFSSVQNNNFDICVGTPPPPPANDNCSTAEVITIGTSCTNISTSTSSATEGNDELPSCDTFGNFGIWYSFVAPANGNLEFTSGAGSPGIVIYSGADCASLTAVPGTCFNNASGSITGLNPSENYFAMVWTDSAETTVEFCLYSLACSPAVATAAVGTTDCTTNNTYNVDVNITDLGNSTSLNVTNDAGLANQSVTTTGTITFGPIPSGTPITITLEHESDSACDVVLPTVNFNCPPSNNDCSNAIALTPGTVFESNALSGQTQSGATDSGELPLPSCSNYDPDDASGFGGDVWYSVVVPADGNIEIETQADPTGSGGDSGMSVYSGTCGSLTEVDCDDDGSSDGFYSLVSISDPTLANQTLYIRIFEFSGNSRLDFQVSAYSSTLAINEFENANAFTYFPNPVKDIFTLRAQSNIQNVSIYNMLGQEVLRTAPNSLESVIKMNDLQTGAYFVKVRINDSIETIRVIKE